MKHIVSINTSSNFLLIFRRISGDTAINYCSYDESAAKDKQLQMQKIHNKSEDDTAGAILTIIVSILALGLLALTIAMFTL